MKVSLGALGVVYGDIGTSPLYALKECFTSEHGVTATPENIAAAALELLRDEKRRTEVQGKLAGVIASLGQSGAPERAAEAILRLI